MGKSPASGSLKQAAGPTSRPRDRTISGSNGCFLASTQVLSENQPLNHPHADLHLRSLFCGKLICSKAAGLAQECHTMNTFRRFLCTTREAPAEVTYPCLFTQSGTLECRKVRLILHKPANKLVNVLSATPDKKRLNTRRMSEPGTAHIGLTGLPNLT